MAQSRLTESSRLLLLTLLILVFAGWPRLCAAQLTSTVPRRDQAAQAKSEEELEAYIEVITAGDPDLVLDQAGRFLNRFPNSELLRKVYESQFDAHYRLGDVSGVISSGDKILKIDPDDIHTLLSLATIVANKPLEEANRHDLLSHAEEYCRRVLQKVETSRAPRTVPLDVVEAERARIRHDAHETLGVIAVKRGKPQQAINEFQTAIKVASTKDGSDLFRLGVALKSAGDLEQAMNAFRDACALGPDSVRRLASAELRKSSP